MRPNGDGRHDHPAVPLNEYALLHPSIPEALDTAGALIHWVTSQPDVVARFTVDVEHHRGDLTPALVHGVLAAVHDVLVPECPDPIPPMEGL